MDKETSKMLNCMVDSNLNIKTTEGQTFNTSGFSSDTLYQGNLSCWHWWQEQYYPQVITQYYPMYIRERSLDNGKRAYEIIKVLKDRKLVEITTVKKFMELMDCLINIL
jgi:hypothetical protein